jgi:hypothetical protein
MLSNWGLISIENHQLAFNNEYKVKVIKKLDLEGDNPWVVQHKFKMTLPKLQRLIELIGNKND